MKLNLKESFIKDLILLCNTCFICLLFVFASNNLCIKLNRMFYCSIFTDSLYCDFNIIYGHNIIRTNQCIIKTRAPQFYKVLKPYFMHINNHIDCIIDKPEIFHHIEGFVRYCHIPNHLSRAVSMRTVYV